MKAGVVACDEVARWVAQGLSGHAQTSWTASSLKEASQLSLRHPVDVLVVEALQTRSGDDRASISCPLVVLRRKHRQDGEAVYRLVSEGAAHVVDLAEKLSDGGPEALVKAVARASSLGPQAGGKSASQAPLPPPLGKLVALGASTGGPHALAEVLKGLGRVQATILIVQHLDPPFIPGLAEWLSAASGVPVELSSRTLSPSPGKAILASTSQHLVVDRQGQLRHEEPRPGELHHPSIDALFKSLSQHRKKGAAALLTGMGRDGAEGLLALKKAGWATFAESEATAVVWGMPKVAVELGAATHVARLEDIGPRLRAALAEERA